MARRDQNLAVPGYLRERLRPCCRQCGRHMRPVYEKESYVEDFAGTRADGSRVYGRVPRSRIVRVKHYGYDERQLFCTLKCGYKFACAKVAEGCR